MDKYDLKRTPKKFKYVRHVVTKENLNNLLDVIGY